MYQPENSPVSASQNIAAFCRSYRVNGTNALWAVYISAVPGVHGQINQQGRNECDYAQNLIGYAEQAFRIGDTADAVAGAGRLSGHYL